MKTQDQIKQYILDTKENLYDTQKQLKEYRDVINSSDEQIDDGYIDHIRYTIAQLKGELLAFELVLTNDNDIKFCVCSPNDQNFYNGICKRCGGHK